MDKREHYGVCVRCRKDTIVRDDHDINTGIFYPLCKTCGKETKAACWR